MGHAEKRKHRVAWLMARIQEGNSKGNCWREDILISEACLQFGAGKRYIKELLTDLSNTKQIVLDLGEVYTKDHFNQIKAGEKSEPSRFLTKNLPGQKLPAFKKNQKGVKKSGN